MPTNLMINSMPPFYALPVLSIIALIAIVIFAFNFYQQYRYGHLGARAPRRLRDVESVWNKYRHASVSLVMEFKLSWWRTAIFRGSGFFISADGYMATASHNCIGSPDFASYTDRGKMPRATEILGTITFPDGSTLIAPCRIVGVCGAADVGLLKVELPEGQSAFTYVDPASSVRTGEACMVIGNPLGVSGQSVTSGNVRDATYVEPAGAQLAESVLVDAPALPGNSGSPVLNARGQTIAIYTFGESGAGGTLGGGVSIPALGRTILQEMMDFDRGHNRDSTHVSKDTDGDYVAGSLGAWFEPVSAVDFLLAGVPTGTSQGSRVTYLMDKWGADRRVKLEQDDVVETIDGRTVGTLPGQVSPVSYVMTRPIGSTVKMLVSRRGKKMTIEQQVIPFPSYADYALAYQNYARASVASRRENNSTNAKAIVDAGKLVQRVKRLGPVRKV